MEKINNAINDKLGWNTIFSYSITDFAQTVFYMTMASYITYFCTNYNGMSAALVGSGIMITRVFDAFSDVFMGWIVDHTKSRYGKARPWLLRGCIPLGICYILLFAMPSGLSENGKFIWFIVFYNLVATVFYTMVATPYQAMNPLLTRDQPTRLKIGMTRMVLSQVGQLIVGFVTIPVIIALGDTKDAWLIWTTIIAVFTLAMQLVTFFTVKETYTESPVKSGEKKKKNSIVTLFKNKYWIMLTLMQLFYMGLNATLGSAQIYYFQYVVGRRDMFQYASLFLSIPAIVVFLLTPRIVRRFSKHAMAMFAAIGTLVPSIFLLIAPTSVWAAFVRAFLQGIFMSGFMANYMSMGSDVADYHYYKTGIRSEGIVLSGCSFGLKCGSGIGGALVGWVIGMAGFDAALAVQPDGVVPAINFLMIGFPIICGIIGVLCMAKYDLDKQLPEIREELAKREAAEAGA